MVSELEEEKHSEYVKVVYTVRFAGILAIDALFSPESLRRSLTTACARRIREYKCEFALRIGSVTTFFSTAPRSFRTARSR